MRRVIRGAMPLGDGRRVLLFATSIVLLFLVAYPLLQLGLKSLPLSNYLTQFRASQNLTALQNTLYIAVGITALATFLGSLFAFLVVRTDLPLKRVVKAGIATFFLTPAYIGSIAWIQLLGRAGYATRWMKLHWGVARPPVDLYTLEGVIVIMGLYMIPLVYMATANVLRNADPAREEAATMAGASPMRILFTVTLPLALPGIVSGAFLVFVRGVAGFGVPAALAMPTGHLVLTTQIYAALGHYDVRMACALSVMLIALMTVGLVFHNRILQGRRFTQTGVPDQPVRIFCLGRWKGVVAAGGILFLILTAFLPLATIVFSSLLKAWGLPGTWDNLTWGNYVSIFSVGLGARALRNSLLFAVGGATCATLVGLGVSYITHRTRLFGRRALDFLATAPLAIPGPVMAAAMIFAWMNPPFRLYNTPWIILAAYTAAFLPYVVRNIGGVLKGMDPRQEEMGWMSRGSWTRVMRDIVLPTIRGGILSGWMLVFLMAFREIPLSTMLYTQGTETVGVLMFVLKTEAGGTEVVSAVAVVVLVITAISQSVVGRLSGARRGIL